MSENYSNTSGHDSARSSESAVFAHHSDLAVQAGNLYAAFSPSEDSEPKPAGGTYTIGGLPTHDPYLAECLSSHLRAEFTDIEWPDDWQALSESDITPQHLRVLRLVSKRRTFLGKCEICSNWQQNDDPPAAELQTQEVVGQFLEAKRPDIAEASLATYANILATFSATFPILPTKPEPIERYLVYKLDSKGPKPEPRAFKSKQLIYSILDGLYEFAHKRLGVPHVTALIARPPKGKRKEADYINLEQLKALEDAILTDRDKALFYLYVDEGFRRSEACRVNTDDIFDDGIRVHGKEREERMPLLPEVREVLLKLAGGRSGNEPVFVSQRGKRLGPDMAAEIIGRLFRRAKVNGVKASPHTLRHSFATLMQTAGCDRYSVELLMRHRTENTTDIYTHMSVEQRLQLLKPKLERYAPTRLLNGHAPNIPIKSILTPISSEAQPRPHLAWQNLRDLGYTP